MSLRKHQKTDLSGNPGANTGTFNWPKDTLSNWRSQEVGSNEWRVPGNDKRDHSHSDGDAMFQFIDEESDMGIDALSSLSKAVFQKKDTKQTINEKLRCVGVKAFGGVDGKNARGQGDSSIVTFGHLDIRKPINHPVPYGQNLYISAHDMKGGDFTEEAKERIRQLKETPFGIKPDIEGDGKVPIDIVSMRPHDVGSAPLLEEHRLWLLGKGSNSSTPRYKQLQKIIYNVRRDIFKSGISAVTPSAYSGGTHTTENIAEIEEYIQADAQYFVTEMLLLRNRYFATSIESSNEGDYFKGFRAAI